jgi:hypothetical protein
VQRVAVENNSAPSSVYRPEARLKFFDLARETHESKAKEGKLDGADSARRNYVEDCEADRLLPMPLLIGREQSRKVRRRPKTRSRRRKAALALAAPVARPAAVHAGLVAVLGTRADPRPARADAGADAAEADALACPADRSC